MDSLVLFLLLAHGQHHELDGCQLGCVYPSDDERRAPHRKSQMWLSNSELFGMELRCRRPCALAGTNHEHKRIKRRMQVDGRFFAVAETSGKYTLELGSAYATETKRACKSVTRQQYKGVETELHVLAWQSTLGKAATTAADLQVSPAVGPCAATFREYMILP